MKTTERGIKDSKDVENMYHMRLMTLLQELCGSGATTAFERG